MDEKDATASGNETSACKLVTVELQKLSYANYGTNCNVQAVKKQHDITSQAALATCCPLIGSVSLHFVAHNEKEALLTLLASQAA